MRTVSSHPCACDMRSAVASSAMTFPALSLCGGVAIQHSGDSAGRDPARNTSRIPFFIFRLCSLLWTDAIYLSHIEENHILNGRRPKPG